MSIQIQPLKIKISIEHIAQGIKTKTYNHATCEIQRQKEDFKVKGKKDCSHGKFDGYASEKVERGKKRYNFKNVWTSDGKRLYTDGSRKIKVYNRLYNLVVNGHVLYYGGKNRVFYFLFVFLAWVFIYWVVRELFLPNTYKMTFKLLIL